MNGATCCGPSSNSDWKVVKTWSSQEWKTDELMEEKTGRPVVFAQHTNRFIVENSYTVAESEMSLESMSFMHRVTDQVKKDRTNLQKMQQRTATNILQYGEHSSVWRMCMSSKLEASVFMGKN